MQILPTGSMTRFNNPPGPLASQRRGGGGRGRAGIWSNVTPHAGSIVPTITKYFGIDLNNLHNLSDADLAGFADRAIAMESFTKILPILEKHCETLIQGQLAYEQFIQKMLKEGGAAAKKIDKAVVDAWLADQGYQQHLNLMGQTVHHGKGKLEAEYQSQTHINNLDFSTALKLVAMRHRKAEQTIQQRIPQAEAAALANEWKSNNEKRRKELLTYGSQGQHGRGVGWFDRLVNWVAG